MCWPCWRWISQHWHLHCLLVQQPTQVNPSNWSCHLGLLDVIKTSTLTLTGSVTPLQPLSNVLCTSYAGHSLGGVMAVLAAYDIADLQPWASLQVYTVGAPRPGNRAFARQYNVKVPHTWHVINPQVRKLAAHAPHTHRHCTCLLDAPQMHRHCTCLHDAPHTHRHCTCLLDAPNMHRHCTCFLDAPYMHRHYTCLLVVLCGCVNALLLVPRDTARATELAKTSTFL